MHTYITLKNDINIIMIHVHFCLVYKINKFFFEKVKIKFKKYLTHFISYTLNAIYFNAFMKIKVKKSQ